MHKNTIFYAAVLLIVYFTLVFCEEEVDNTETQTPDLETLLSTGRDLLEVEGRTRRRHRFWLRHLWPLAIAYWIKVKVVIVSFFVGSAIYLGLRYFWPHKCNQEIILDHPPPSYTQHDHIPYSLAHSQSEHIEHYDSPTSYDSSSFDPYSAYSGYSSGSDIISDDHSYVHSDPTAPSSSGHPNRRGKRSIVDDDEEVEEVDEEISESVARQMPAEEQIADFMFAFLGLDSKACRRRFVCEMEFRSKLNPLSSMAFRIVGRGFFEKYTNALNPQARATNFSECATVNPECIFVEHEAVEATGEESATEESSAAHESTVEASNELTEEGNLEAQNEENLQAERRHAKQKHRRGDRMLDSIAEHIMTQ
ncbi:uncharacterized protein LOC115628049 [Scaptodrosophila lebanonensis]|uniref:Uncharacterized protein LOC115628049 n=1 Tax=Drosophila lebanonensis TaxID=7225 RepID=A0A6J2TXG7_DROLE|nr:uncharacterized protein LOC115628049 [Scaptodrosophila lebanonensis]